MVRLDDYIEECNERNIDNKYGIKDVRGVSIQKKFIPTKARMDNVSVSSYKLVRKNQFAANPNTARMGDKVSIALNETNDTYLVSSIYPVFQSKNENELDPHYLYLWFCRDDFNRYVRFHSWGSAREMFSMNDYKRVIIPLPTIEKQHEIVAVWQGLQKMKEENESIAAPLLQLCHSYIQDLKHSYPLSEIGPHLQFFRERNKDKEITLEQGINISKEFITPQRTNSDLTSRVKVRTGQFAYCTQLNNENVAIAYRTGPDCVVSPVYEVFEIKKESRNILLPEYLFLWLARPEFGRYVYWSSVGSAYEFLRSENLNSYKIAFPPIDIQRAIVEIYRCSIEAKKIAKEAEHLSREICPALLQYVINEN